MSDWQKIKAILLADSKIRYRYVNKNGETCAVGGLMVAAGIKLPKPLTAKNKIGVTYYDSVDDQIKQIMKYYGLELHHLESIQRINDEHVSVNHRHKALAEYCDTQKRLEKRGTGC